VTFRFEGLEIFQAAIDFSARVHETVKKVPAEELSHRKRAVLPIEGEEKYFRPAYFLTF
jgi:hypothetical protein